jgi:hypothetical protein
MKMSRWYNFGSTADSGCSAAIVIAAQAVLPRKPEGTCLRGSMSTTQEDLTFTQKNNF